MLSSFRFYAHPDLTSRGIESVHTHHLINYDPTSLKILIFHAGTECDLRVLRTAISADVFYRGLAPNP